MMETQVEQTAPGVWAVGPGVTVYRHDHQHLSVWSVWECQQCQIKTVMPGEFGCEHIKAVWRRL